jgi:acetyl esterase/lipase
MNPLNYILPYFSNIIKPNWTVYKDIPYGVSKSETADLYLLNRGVRPVVVFIHGGGWSAGDKSAYEGRARRYALAGFHVIAINYRLATYEDKTTQWPAQFQDVQNAIRWVRSNAVNFRIDPNRIGVGGDSAGGHLALMVGANPNTIPGDRSHLHSNFSPSASCILDVFGPCDLGGAKMKDLIGVLPLFNNTTYEQNPGLYQSASPIYAVTALFPPTCIIHGTKDDIVPYAQSVMVATKLNQLGVYHKFYTFDGGHELKDTSLEMKGLDFMRSVLKP